MAFLTDTAIARVQQRTRRRVLKLFQRRAMLSEDVTELMLGWRHSGGLSLNAEVWVPSRDRAALELLLRYCARPVFARNPPGADLNVRSPAPQGQSAGIARSNERLA